jgi:hypothetical protein
MTIVKTKDGVELYLDDIKEVMLLNSSFNIPHYGWLIFWTLMFFPMAVCLVLYGLTQKKYTCVLLTAGIKEAHTFDETNYHLLRLKRGLSWVR